MVLSWVEMADLRVLATLESRVSTWNIPTTSTGIDSLTTSRCEDILHLRTGALGGSVRSTLVSSSSSTDSGSQLSLLWRSDAVLEGSLSLKISWWEGMWNTVEADSIWLIRGDNTPARHRENTETLVMNEVE